MNSSTAIRYNSTFLLSAIVLYLISPVFSVVLIFYGLRNLNYGAFFMMALFLATLAYVMVPAQDLYRHTLNYYYWAGRPFSCIKYSDFMMNGLITYVEWFMSNYRIPFEYLRFAEIFTTFLLLGKILNYHLENSPQDYSRRQLFQRIIIFLLFYDFFYIAEGVRFGLSLSIYIYGIHELIDKKSILKCMVFIVLAGLIHIAFWAMGPLSLIIYNLKLNRKTSFIAVIVLIILMGILLPEMSPLLGPRVKWYFSEKKSDFALYSAMTILGMIGFWLPKIASLPFIWILYKKYSIRDKWMRIAMTWLIIAAAMSSNPVTFYRFIWVFMAICPYMLLDVERIKKVKDEMITLLILSGCLFASINTLRYYDKILYSPVATELMMPAPLLFSSDTHFEKKWIFEHIRKDGSHKHD